VVPDRTGQRKTIVWTQAGVHGYIFAANMDTQSSHTVSDFEFPDGAWQPVFSTHDVHFSEKSAVAGTQQVLLEAGEGLIWKKIT
jgi:hypothetical protein